MPPLNRAIALADGQHVAEVIGQHLNFDMARAIDKPLQVDIAIAKRRLGFRLRQRQRAHEIGLVPDDPHAAATAAGDRLDQQRIPDPARDLTGVAEVLTAPSLPGTIGTPASFHHLAGLSLVPHQLDDFRTRTDERHPDLPADLGQIRILGQKPVARDGWRRSR